MDVLNALSGITFPIPSIYDIKEVLWCYTITGKDLEWEINQEREIMVLVDKYIMECSRIFDYFRHVFLTFYVIF